MQTDRRPLADSGKIFAVILAAAMLFGPEARTQNQGGLDPAEIWFSAFTVLQEGEEAQKSGNFLLALAKFNESKPLFDGLAKQFPDYHPDLVRFRREQLVEVIGNIRDQMKSASKPQSSLQPNPGIINNGGGAVGAKPPATVEVTPNPEGTLQLPEPWRPAEPPAAPAVRHPDAVVRPPQGSAYQPPATADLGEIHQSRISWMQQEIDRLNQRNHALESELFQRQSFLDGVQAELAETRRKAATREQEYRQAKASAGNDPNLKAHAAELERLLTEAFKELDDSLRKNEAVVSELQNTQQAMAQLRREKEGIEKERDTLMAIVDSGGDGNVVKNLMAENRRIAEQLAQAEELAYQIGQEKDSTIREKDSEIVMLKTKIERIDTERKQLLADNARYDRNIADLQNRLRELGQEPSAVELNQMAAVSPKLVEENELLRTVVLKQIRRQRQIQKTKSILLGELDKLGNEAATLYALVDDIATGPDFSTDQRKMISNPGIQELVDAAAIETVNATIVVEGQEPGGVGEGILDVKNLDEELMQIQKAARLDFREGRFDEAEENYLKYLKYRPRSVICLCNLALVKMSTKSYSEAETFLEKAIALKSDHAFAHYLLGRTYFNQGRLDDALSRLSEGLQYDPKNSRAHNCVGVISSEKGFVNRAESAFIEAISIDPAYADAHFNLAVLFSTRDKPDIDRAQEHYNKAVNLGAQRDAAIEDFLKKAVLTTAAVLVR